MSGEFGLCGYFREHDRDLGEDERLVFAPHERPPAFDPARQPELPATEWTEERLAKANRNYAIEYIRNGVRELVHVIGEAKALEHGKLAARLTGLQHYRHMAEAVGGVDGGPREAADFLGTMFLGMGDRIEVRDAGRAAVSLHQTGLRIARGLAGPERDHLLACWIELWRGAVHSHRAFMSVETEVDGDALHWRIRSA